MSQPKLSQTTLYEILVSEVESLKTTKRSYEKLLSEINLHLNRLEELYKNPVPVDTKSLYAAQEHIQSTLANVFYIPKWLVAIFFLLVVGFCLSLGINYKQYLTHKAYRSGIEYAKEYIQQLEEKLPKPRK